MHRDTLCVLASFRAKSDQIDAFALMMSSLCEPTRAEPGCISYELQQSMQEPTLFVFVEEWGSEDDLTNHLKTSHVQAVSSRLETMLVSPPTVDRYRRVP